MSSKNSSLTRVAGGGAGFGWGLAAALLLTIITSTVVAVESPAPAAAQTNAQETLQSILKLQEQLSATQLAIERSQQEADAAALRRAEAVEGRLSGIERNLAASRAKELEAIQSSNKVMLSVACVFGALGCAAMLLTAFFQWRTVNQLTELSGSLPLSLALGAGADNSRLAIGPPGESNQRLLGALDKLEKRILELEHTSRPPLESGAPPSPAPPEGPNAAQITLLLGKGQSLLNLDQNEEAAACFDEVLALDNNHPEALVRKGAALERLRKLEEAIVCYDRAIAADGSMTMAYLYKGGLFNRLERFNEALECYEQALRTQETRHA
jgi:tetratricopeptide (TPR) repeat protein